MAAASLTVAGEVVLAARILAGLETTAGVGGLVVTALVNGYDAVRSVGDINDAQAGLGVDVREKTYLPKFRY